MKPSQTRQNPQSVFFLHYSFFLSYLPPFVCLVFFDGALFLGPEDALGFFGGTLGVWPEFFLGFFGGTAALVD